MTGSEMLKSKLDKVKSFIDNESFVFTFTKTKPFGIHKDQLFKNQIYEIKNETELVRKNSKYIKRERITNIETFDRVTCIYYNSGKVFCKVNNDDLHIILKPFETYVDINGVSHRVINRIKKVIYLENDLYSGFVLTDTNSLFRFEIDHYSSVESENDAVEGNEEAQYYFIKNNVKNIFNFIPYRYSSSEYTEETINEDNDTAVAAPEISEQVIDFYNSKCIYIFTSDNELYIYNTNISDINQENALFHVEYEHGFKYLENIKGRYLIFKTGKCLTLEINGQNIILTQVLNKEFIKDVSVGKYHDIFLTKTGEVFGCGENHYGQLACDKEQVKIIDYVKLQYGNERIREITATPYGTVMLSEHGKLIFTGTFINGELGITTENNEGINVEGTIYTNYFSTNKLLTISRTEVMDENGEYKLKNVYILKLFNVNGTPSIFVIKEDGKLYYTGKNTRIIGDSFGDADSINVWTPVENGGNYIGRDEELRTNFWSYYFDYIMKCDKNVQGNTLDNVFFKLNDIWIDWNGYISKYMNINIKDESGNSLPKYMSYKDENDNILRTSINFNSFIEYFKNNFESISNEFKVDRKVIPSVDYIDENLNVWSINIGDNIIYSKYTEDDIEILNRNYYESLNNVNSLIEIYENALNSTKDPIEILQYQDKLAIEYENRDRLQESIDSNNALLGTLKHTFDFKDNLIFNPLDVVGTEEKVIKYTRSKFTEPNEDGECEIETTENNGNISVVKDTITKNVESNITKLKIDVVNYDRVENSNISNAEVLRDDIKMTIMDDPKDDRDFAIDDLLIWLNGKFITKDIIANDKSFYIKDGIAGVETRHICEFPGFGEPIQNDIIVPNVSPINATVNEPTVPTELRWNFEVKTFGWKNIKIDGPYKIHDNRNVSSELRKPEYFYFGDVYCSVFTEILIYNRACAKNTFLLFFGGSIVPEDEYDVTVIDNKTYIKLKSFTSYVVSLLQDMVDPRKPGSEGEIRHIVSQFDEMNQFAIAFLSSSEEFKKAKVIYDYHTIRDYPKAGQIMFDEIKYNDLILIDGYYIPYLWESHNCIRIPETINTVRTSENSFIHHSSICNVKVYSTYKKESELSDSECRIYARKNNLATSDELTSLDISYIRERVRNHLDIRNNEI